MEVRRKKQDNFQIELAQALRKRREMEKFEPTIQEEDESEVDTEDEMYRYDSDAFSEESTEMMPIKKQPSSKVPQTSKIYDDWDLPFLKDNDDPLEGGGSYFLKDKKESSIPKKTIFDPLGMGTKPIKEESESNDDEDDPIMKLLRKHSPEPTPKPSARTKERSRKSPGRETIPKGLEERKRHDSSLSRPKTPISGKASSDLKGILDSMQSKDTPDPLTTKPRAKSKQASKDQGFVDFLLDSQPKPIPRKKASAPPSIDSKSSRSPTRSLSPPSRHEERKKSSDMKTQRSVSGEREAREALSSINRPVSPRTGGQSYSSLGLPTLQTRGRPLTAPIEDTSIPKLSGSPPLHPTEKAKSKSDTDDLLALFNRAVVEDNVDFQAHMKPKEEKPASKTPVEVVVQKTAQQTQDEGVKQRPSRQLIHNVIENVARHNDGSEVSSMSTASLAKTKSPRTRSGKKSYRTPPADYQGLGSLTMLKELKQQKKGTELGTEDNDVTSEDIRKKIYLEWLAKREEEAKKKRKEKAQKEKEEKEKLQKEKEEKEMENALVRKKWEDVKKEELKEKAKERRKEEHQQEKIQAEKERQKAKSEKDAEKRRQLMLGNARIQHHAEMRRKHDEERKKKNKQQKQKDKNKKALDEWMDERSEKWVDDRKKENKERRKQQKQEKKEKKDAAKEAEEKYKAWREQKDDQLKSSMRESRLKQRRLQLDIYEDEENMRPPWSPPNKVIPRKR